MRAVVASGAGGPEVLSVGEVPEPTPGSGEVLVDVAATAVNRADTPAAAGLLPAAARRARRSSGSSAAARSPSSARTSRAGRSATRCARCSPAAGTPSRWRSRSDSCCPCRRASRSSTPPALPEVACTVWSNVFMVAGLQPGETLLVHGGAGGIGTMAIQLATALSAHGRRHGRARRRSWRRAPSSAPTCDQLPRGGLRRGVLEARRRGADVILDNMGAKYLARNVDALATERPPRHHRHAGRHQGRARHRRPARASAAPSSRPRCARARSGEKATICAAVREHVWPLIADGAVVPVIHDRLPLEEVETAHRLMEDSGHVGKIVLTLH